MIHTRLNECWAERRLALCSVDPVTLGTMAVAGLAAGGAQSLLSGGGAGSQAASPTAPAAPAPQAAPQSSPTTAKPKPQSQSQTFLGAAAAPMQSSGQKTLLGQ